MAKEKLKFLASRGCNNGSDEGRDAVWAMFGSCRFSGPKSPRSLQSFRESPQAVGNQPYRHLAYFDSNSSRSTYKYL